MGKEIIGFTQVIIKGNEFNCKTFPELWGLFERNKISIDDKNKEYLIRLLFINGCADLKEYGADIQLKIVW